MAQDMTQDTLRLTLIQDYNRSSSLRKWRVLCWELNLKFSLSSRYSASGSWKRVPNSRSCRTEAGCFPSTWSEGSFPLIRDVTSLYWTLTSLSMSKHRYYFHLLLQNVICSSSIWMRTLQPTALYVTLYHFLLRYHRTWHFWLLNAAHASVRAWLCCNAEWYYAYYYSKYCLLLRE